mmetsp:Transcript_4038/g.5856  ORF Transcript_4038/g.5856 Transcript_4038/m.5856 type:complete len:241 (+) Transcript_4038:747-1469(+)
MEVVVLLSSRSHHCLWSSSSFCSFIRWKIIFSMELMTWSKGPSPIFVRVSTSSARRSRALEWTCLASSRRRCRAFRAAGLPFLSSRKETTGVGKLGLPGASVLTPVTFARMEMAVSIASISPALVLDRSSHSVFFRSQALFVSEREALSASRSAWVLAWLPSAVASCSAAEFRSVFLADLDSSLAVTTLVRAWFASVKALIALVSAAFVAVSSSSNLRANSFKSSTTLSDLNLYPLMWES